MTFYERLKMAVAAYKGIGQGAVDLTGSNDPFAIWADQGKLSARRALDMYTAWSYACIRAIAQSVAGLEFELWQINKDGTHEQIHEHELLDLLDGVNPYQTGYELRYITAAHLEAAGNTYWYLEGVEKVTDKPVGIYPLNAGSVTVEVNKNIFPFSISGYRYSDQGKTMRFTPEQILHIKYPDPNDPFRGIGTIQAISGWIDADNFATEFNRRFFMNGAWLGVMLESEAITPAQIELLRNTFEAAHKGLENAHRAVVLPKGTKASKPNEGMKDMDFKSLQDTMMNKILAGFQVPRTVLGITDDVNRANAEATNYVFADRTIKPKLQMICTYLNEFLVPRYGSNLYLSFKDPVPENRDLRIKEMEAAVGRQPVITQNEAREEYFGLEGVENGDNLMTDFNKIPVGKPQPKQLRKPASKSAGPGKVSAKGARAAKARHSITEGLAEKIANDLASINKQASEARQKAMENGIQTLSDDDFEPIYKQFVSRVERYEKLLAGKVRDYNDAQKEIVLANLEKATKDVDPSLLYDESEQVQAFIDLSDPVLTELFKEEAEAAALLIGTEAKLPKEVMEALKESIALLAKKYNETTLEALETKLNEALSQGAGIPELKNIVSDIYEFSNRTRAEMVARTETFRIANGASKEAWKQAGVVKTIKWYTSADERVCEFCGPMHGKIIAIEKNFFDKGDTVTGENGGVMKLTYNDIGTPPLHVDCRCYTRPEEISVEN